MTVYRIIASMVAALSVPFALGGIIFHNRPTLQNPALWIASDLYSRALLLLTPEERAQHAKKIQASAVDARQKGSQATADLLETVAAVTARSASY